MKILLTIFLTISTIINTRGQEITKQDLFRPFSVIIIKPDNAKISDSLNVYAQRIEDRQFLMYFSVIKSLEKEWEKKNDEQRKEIEQQIHETIVRAKDDSQFKYFHTIANRTLRELKSLFNSNEIETDYTLDNPVLTGEVVDRSQLSTLNPKKIGKSYKVDYIVSFENIHTTGTKQSPTFSYVLKLVSTTENKEILRKEIEGNASVDNYKSLREIFPPGNIHEIGVDCDNYLECMIISAVRFSTEELFRAIEKRQKK